MNVLPVMVPIVAAVLYNAGSFGMKRAMLTGASSARVLIVSNVAVALCSLPLFFFFPGQWNTPGFFAALLAGASLFLGRIFSVKALEAGDLSLVVPLLAMKTLMVALCSIAMGTGEVSGRLLIAAVLATGGVVLLQRGPAASAALNRKALGYAMLASVLFTVTDLSVQGHARAMGLGYFQPLMFVVVCLMLPLLGRPAAAPSTSRPALWWGSGLMGLQTTAVILTIGLTGQATLVNVLYSTRSLWGVVVDVWTGAEVARLYWKYRLAGAVLLTSAVVLAILR